MSPCLIASLFVIFKWFPCLMGCSVRSSRGPCIARAMTWRLKLRLIPFASLVLVPFLHLHGTWIYSCIFPAPWWPSLASCSPHRAPGRCCVERMQELHNNGLHGAGQPSVSICSPSQHHLALMKLWLKSLKKGCADTKQKGHKSQAQTQQSCQNRHH